MNHIVIKQDTSGTEEVSSAVITALYNAVNDEYLDNNSELQGRLHVDIISQKKRDYFQANFPNLYIQSDSVSIEFNDPIVTDILTTNYGELTDNSLSSISNISNIFKDSNISDFSDMNLLTSISTLAVDAFYGCSNLTTINLANIQQINYAGGLYQCHCFHGCSKLKSVYAPNLVYGVLGGGTQNCMFSGCSLLEYIDMPNLVGFGTQNNGFRANFHGSSTPMLKYINFGHYQFNFGQGDGFHAGNFTNLSNLLIVDAGDDVKEFSDWAIQNCANLKAIVFRNSSVVTFNKRKGGTSTIATVAGGSSNAYFYVPDNLVSAYQADANWGAISDRILGISSYDKDAILASS